MLNDLSSPFQREKYLLPIEFTYPFDYEPHPLAVEIADQLKKEIHNIPVSIHNFDEIGKMFGILIYQDKESNIGYLKAFSGKLQSGNHYQDFVPPVFDMLEANGFYRKGEEELNGINLKIKQIDLNPTLIQLTKQFEEKLLCLQDELSKANKDYKEGKTNRKALRSTVLKEKGIDAEAAIKTIHKKESLAQQFRIKQLKLDIKTLNEKYQRELQQFEEEKKRFKKIRKEKSAQLQAQLFQAYDFLNFDQEIKNVLDIFKDYKNDLPPSGSGECAAPKLLQYAYQNNLKPIALAEFWWGKSPAKEIRKQGDFYPACRSKCEPILNHMLKGLNVAPNPRANLKPKANLEIIYEDDFIAIVNKPAEMLSTPGKIDSLSAFEILQGKYPSSTGPLLVHRLDQSTSGILVMAKTKGAHAYIQEQFANREVQKRYEALLDGVLLDQEGKISLPLRVDLDNRPRQLVCFEHGKVATTYYKVTEVVNNQTRIQFFPQTGRTHQLRVHAAHQKGLNTPIVGDDLYGKRADRLHLHAAFIKFRHPDTHREVSFSVPTPF